MKAKISGLPAWLVQRVSAVYMLLFIVFAVASLSLRPRHTYSEWHAWIAHPGMSIALFIFFVALLGHMGVGLRDVLFDYVRPARLRPVLLNVLIAGLLGMAAWLVWILWRAQG
ncbi:succinate dehydrogenase / fumarate reductase membrane anchor subunit [Polaromonas sp. CG_9.5]|uniref:succinate dehydrogenase, hydrophobic membrane anchor protein n=1 Tax=Polaromonas sp. CG_9.5 TaxID=3071705 RepID=UPI002DFF43AC|nr:succinate dehydrogenase / fumarate reductase membrane anchor subunit [Polaromonas sp. CG_9.5]